MLCLLLSTSAAAKADTITQKITQNYTSSFQTSESTSGFLPFDTRLGTLNSATATFTGNVLFAPSAPGGSFTTIFDHFNRGGSGSISITDTQSRMFNLSVVLNPLFLTDSSGFQNYFLVSLDTSATNGMVLAGSSATGSLIYNYTAVTPEPSSLLLIGTGLVGLSGNFYRRSIRKA